MKKIKIALTGGGTAGHIWPTLDVAEKILFTYPEAEFIYLGSARGLEAEIVPKTKIKFYQILSGKLRRYWSWKNIIDPFRVLIGFFQSLMILKRFKPDVLFAKGGYVTLPVVLASRIFKIPIVLHESDSIMGLTNRILFRFAQKVMTAFPTKYYYQKFQPKIFYSGLPVRKEFFKSTQGNQRNFQLSERIPTILITGGSQGAHKINQMVFKILRKILKEYQLIHLTGKLDFEAAQRLRNRLPEDLADRYKIYHFLNDKMPQALKSADLIVSRAGANTLMEIAILKKPSILIPLPTAASDHQYLNAQVFQEFKAAVIIEEKDLTPQKLVKTILNLLTRKVLLEQLGRNARKLAKPEAAKIIADHILSLVK